MSPWMFVIAAYGVAIIGTGGLIAWAAISMHRAEKAADALRRK